MSGGEAGAPRPVDLVGLEWVRIQVVVRLRLRADADLEPGRLVLRRIDEQSVEMPPTRAWPDETGALVARFNVMQGPGRVPLEVGRWRLTVAGTGLADAGLEITPAATVDVAAAGRRFLTERGEYAVQPVLEPSGQLTFDVRLNPSVRPPPDPTRRRATLRKRFVLPVLGWGFQLLYTLARLGRRPDGRRILFMARYGTELPGDMQAILARMAERGLDREYRIVTVLPLRSRGARGWLRAPWELARAGTIVIDEDILSVISPIHARVIQLWHASGALKTIGYSRIGKPGARSPWSRRYKYFTYAIVSGEHDVPLFAEAFGMPEERVVPTGHPRMDRFFDEAWRERARQETLEAFPEARGRRVILFAPTWRQSAAGRVYDLGILDYARLHALCLEQDAVFIIRLHPTVRRPVPIPEALRDRILDGSSTVMDAPAVLCATDLLITDYSSIILEYSLLGRPMLFFAYDLDAYRADRDVYMPYEEFVPGRIVGTFEELLEAIRRDDYEIDKVGPFAARHFSHFDAGATDRVIDLILGR